MSRSLPRYARALSVLACAGAIGSVPFASADTCTGLSLTALTPAPVGTTPVAVAVGDFNRDGLLDVVAANSGSNDISVLLGNGAGGFTQEVGSPILVGGSPSDIAMGDLDRDGYLDLVVTLGTQIKVMRRLPAGGFDNTSIPVGVGFTPNRIYLIDLTRDARLDLVVVGTADNRVAAYQGNGLGFPSVLATIDTSLPGPPERPAAAASGDFNRDGKTDLAVAFESSNDVNVYFGNGLPSGSFNWAAGPSITLVGVTTPRDIVAGDIDRDGWPDLVTANIGSGDASVLRNLGGVGLSQVAPSLPIGSAPMRLALVDLNQDGVLDLAVLDDSSTPRVASFQGLKTGPPWFDTAAAATTLPPGAALRGLAVGRFTADGRLDLVTALSGPGQVAVVENRSGTPCARSSFALAPRSYLVGDRPVASAAADFDHDGRQDLVVATGSDKYIRILRNVNGGFVTGTQVGPLSIAPRGVATADMNVDGHPDVVVAQGDVGAGQVRVYLGDGMGGLPTAGGSQPAGLNTSALVIGDFNGDGAPDVAATAEGSNRVYVFLGDGAGGLAAGTFTPVGTSPHALVAGFFDAGPTLDLAVANLLSNDVSILYGNGNGTFAAGPVLGVATNPQGIAAADLDGNGHLDIVTADNGAARVSVILRDGAGAFLPAVGYGVGTQPTAVALLDLVNGDGRAEIVVTTAAGSGAQMLSVLPNNGSGSFGAQSDHPVRNSPQAITPIDADGDGLVDVAIPCSTSDAVVILVNRSPGPPLFSAAPRAAVHAKPRGAAVGDFDGDGDLDLAVANSVHNSVSLLNGDGAGGLAEYDFKAASGAEAVVAADFNRDGQLDLAVSAPGAPSVVILFGTGGGAFTPQAPVTNAGLTAPDDLVVGDFDRDGDLDIAVCNKEASGTVFILNNTGAGAFNVVTGPTVGNKPTAIVAADFDRDGDLDLAVADDDSNDVMILTNSSGVFGLTQTLMLDGGDTSPISLAAADFDANGIVDLAAASIDFDRIHVYRNTGTAGTPFIATPLTFAAPALLQSITAADVNLDGRPDLVATAAGLSVLRGRGGLDFDPAETVVARHTPVAAVVADFNRDGRPDVVVVNQDSDDLTILSSSACAAQHLEASLLTSACDVSMPFLIDATVTAFDDGGNAAICAAGTVIPSIVPPTGGAILGGPASLAFVSGVASFAGANGLTIDTAGRYRLQFQTAGLAPARSGSVSLLEPATTLILGPDSVCPGSMAVYSTNQTFDTYAWTITPSGSPLPQFTASVTLAGPPLAGGYTLKLEGRNECLTSVNRNIYFGDLASVSLQLQGVSSVCVDCIGGSAKAVELGGGMPTAWQWGYRTVSAIGSVTPLAGETADTYVLKGVSFPGPGTYYVVVTSTPTCGSPVISTEWPVTVVAGVPSGEVRYLAASSRGTAATGQNNLLWVNTAAPLEIRIRWNKALNGSINCLPPDSLTSPANSPPMTDEVSILSPTAGAKDAYLHSSLVPNTAYCYSVFVRTGAGWSAGRTVKARPFDSTGPVKWAYATGGTAVAPPTVSADGILAMSNDRTVHALTRGAAGGDWPGPWMPTELAGVAHSRSPVVPFPLQLNGADNVLFVADDSGGGVLHAIDAKTGGAVWADQPQAKPVTGAPGGMFMQFGGMRDLLVVGTRDTLNNELRGLSVAAGTLLQAYAGAGSGGLIGPISGTPAIDYATNRVYFASRQQSGGDTLFCLNILPGGPPVFGYAWSRNLGDITGSPVLKGGRVYVGTDAGVVYSLDAATGADDHTPNPPLPADGPIKGFLFPDRRGDDLIFATDTTVWSVSDDGPAMSRNWQWTTGGLNPSLVLYWPQTNFVYVGSKNGELYELDFTSALPSTPPTSKLQVLGGGFGQIGAPSLDIGVTPKLLVVGSEPGVVYGVAVPYP